MKSANESYFIRHVGIPGAEALFKTQKIAIHYGNIASIDPAKYLKGSRRSAIERFVRLANDGGCVWAQYQYGDVDKVLVGVVEADSQIKFESKENLKTLQLKKVHEIQMGDLMSMRAGVPREGTFVRWHIVGDRIWDIVKGRQPQMIWDNLSHSQQETVCAEFLRQSNKSIPRLQHLLLPVGRTMKDVDIYGVTSLGSLLFGQVTFSSNPRTILSKVASLEKYKNPNEESKLVFFSPQTDQGLYKDLVASHPEMKFISTDEVFDWLRISPSLRDHLFL
ncbi:MAG: hypothetical protein WCT02_04370 [Candidatus Paceibacterota bacterium]